MGPRILSPLQTRHGFTGPVAWPLEEWSGKYPRVNALTFRVTWRPHETGLIKEHGNYSPYRTFAFKG